MNEPPGARARVALTGLTVAEYFRDQEGQNVLLFIDNIFRFTQAGSEVGQSICIVHVNVYFDVFVLFVCVHLMYSSDVGLQLLHETNNLIHQKIICNYKYIVLSQTTNHVLECSQKATAVCSQNPTDKNCILIKAAKYV